MKVLVFSVLLVVLVRRTSAEDMCDVLKDDPSRVEMIYVCIESLSGPELKYQMYLIKNDFWCDKTYVCFVRIACLNPPYDDFMFRTLKKDGEIFCEFRKWTKVCQKDGARRGNSTAETRSNALVRGRDNNGSALN